MTPQRKLGFEIAGLLLFLCLVILLLELRYSTYATGADVLVREFDKKKSKSEILWLGNSHTLPFVWFTDQHDPDSLFSSLAYGGIDLFWTQILLQRFIDELPELKLILIGVDEDLLGYNQSVFGVEYGNRAFYRYTDTLYKDSKTERFLASSNFFRSNRDLSYLYSSKQQVQGMDSSLQNRVFSAADVLCSQRALEHSEIRFSPVLLEENSKYIREIISIARQNNTRLIFFIPPKSDCYLNYRKHQNILNARAILDLVLYEENIPLIDMNEGKIYPDSVFRDPDHLNRIGAKICLDRLADFVIGEDSTFSELFRNIKIEAANK